MDTTQNSTFGEPLETFLGTGEYDNKGREIGFIVGFNDDGKGDFRAWVQAARKTAPGEFHDFGVRQRSKGFKSQVAATGWAYSEARNRIAKIKQKSE